MKRERGGSWTRLVPASIFALLLSLADGQACVGCREAGTQTMATESPTVLAGIAFSWSVLFMLACAFAVVGSLGGYIWKRCRQLDRRQQ